MRIFGHVARCCYAHALPGRVEEEWQDLREHLEGVSKRAAASGAYFHAGDWARVARLWHDLGKFSRSQPVRRRRRRVRLPSCLGIDRFAYVLPVGKHRMTDIVDSKRRSEFMAGIRGRDTAPELAVRRIAHRMGLRFRLDRKDLPGRPDLVFPRHRLVVFVHGCFWHRHEGCRYASTPKSRIAFWTEKFAANVARDARQEATLRALGWRILVIWECETRHKTAVERRLAALIEGEGSASERKSTLSLAVMEHQAPTREVDASTRLRSVPGGVESGLRATSTVDLGFCEQT